MKSKRQIFGAMIAYQRTYYYVVLHGNILPGIYRNNSTGVINADMVRSFESPHILDDEQKVFVEHDRLTVVGIHLQEPVHLYFLRCYSTTVGKDVSGWFQ